MKSFRITLLAGAVCLAGSFNPAYAQTSGISASPFGKVTAEPKVKVNSPNENALAAWQNLPAKHQESMTAEMATMSQADRLAYLQSVPSLKNLTPEEQQLLLGHIAQTTPYPVALTIQPQEVHFLAHGYSGQLTAYLNNAQLPHNQVTWTTATPTNLYPALIIDASGVVRFRPTAVPLGGSATVTAAKADDPSVTATARAYAHGAKMDVTAVPEIKASGGTVVSTLVTIDARVPEPQGPVLGPVTFYLRVPTRFNPDNRVPLCNATLAAAAVETAGVRSSTASCAASALPSSPDLVPGQSYTIMVAHHHSALYPKQGLWYGAQGNSLLVP